jgi:hypothetical protein
MCPVQGRTMDGTELTLTAMGQLWNPQCYVIASAAAVLLYRKPVLVAARVG